MSKRKPQANPHTTAMEAALTMLGRRPLSIAELTKKLHEKAYPDADIMTAVEKLRAYKYLNDQALAALIHKEAARVGRGPQWVKYTLRRRGIVAADTGANDDTNQEGSMGELANAGQIPPDPVHAQQRAKEILLRRFGSPTQWDMKQRQRAYRFLVSRGFTPSDIHKILRPS